MENKAMFSCINDYDYSQPSDGNNCAYSSHEDPGIIYT